MNKKTVFITAMCLLCTVLCAKEFVLYKNGKALADIVVENKSALDAKKQRSVRISISELNAGARKCKLPAMRVLKKALPSRNTLLIRIVEKPIDKMDEYEIDFPGRNAMRITATTRSLKYALDELQEIAFGVRFLLHTPHWLKPPRGYDRSIEYVYPARKNASIARKTLFRKASLNFKRYFSGDIPKEWRVCHAFPAGHGMALNPFPASKYAPNDSWPKEILPIHNGKRYKMPKYKKPSPEKLKNNFFRHVQQYSAYMGDWNPCFSNPKTVTIAAANIIEKLQKNPVSALYGGYKEYNICLGVNDNGGNCECSKCLAAIKGKWGPFGPDYSDLYWKWVNNVAEIVTKKYPKLYFNCLAYREVTNPPSFKLHPNVIPMICRELNAGFDPVQRKKIEELFKAWNKKATNIFLWDYSYGSKYFVIPMVYFNTHAKMMKMAYKYNLRGMYCEASDRINMGGPKLYLIAKTMWDVNIDVNAELRKWCIDAVGPKAAPDLEKYYKFWENYFLRKDFLKTNFANSARNIYMTLGDSGSYTYALRRGEMASLRKLLENVVKKAQTPDQKARAKHFLKVFAISEDATKCLYSEFIEPDGFVKDAQTGAALLRSIPEAYKALERLKKNPLVTSPQLDQHLIKPVTVSISNLRSISKFVKHPVVRKELDRLSKNKSLPAELRAQAKVLLGVPFKNLMKDNSFENPIPRNTEWCIHRGKINPALASHGKRSFGGVNPLVRRVQTKDLVFGKKYMVLVDVYAAKNSAEGFVNLLFNPMTAQRKNTNYVLLSRIKLNQGWQTLSNTISLSGRRAGQNASELFVQIWGSKFEKDEPIYFDNVRLYQLD